MEDLGQNFPLPPEIEALIRQVTEATLSDFSKQLVDKVRANDLVRVRELISAHPGTVLEADLLG
jgi:hypothetical protein